MLSASTEQEQIVVEIKNFLDRCLKRNIKNQNNSIQKRKMLTPP
jgi:hypothetical protein